LKDVAWGQGNRYHLVIDVIDRVPTLRTRAAALRLNMLDTRLRAKAWTRQQSEDLPDIAN
jgi:xylulose-5-phosphate/fructose-6-phosphate phosphoketolase